MNSLLVLILCLVYSVAQSSVYEVKALKLENSTCILFTDNKMSCWGRNNPPTLPTADAVATPTLFEPMMGLVAIDMGTSHTCALNNSGAVKCWGHIPWVPSGKLNYSEVDVKFLDRVTAITAERSRSCALLVNGEVWCLEYDQPKPKLTSLPDKARQIDGVENHTCVVLQNGKVWCWGQLGSGPNGRSVAPLAEVSNLDGVKSVAVGHTFNCAIDRFDGVKCWGDDSVGQLGRGQPGTESIDHFDKVAQYVKGLESGVKSISADVYQACAVKKSGDVYCWGMNSSGSVGAPLPVDYDGGDIFQRVSVTNKIPGITNAESITVSSDLSCARLIDKKIMCWGSGFNFMGNGGPIHLTPYELKSDLLRIK